MTGLQYILVLGIFVLIGGACVFIANIPEYWLKDSFESLAFIVYAVIIAWFFAAPALIKGFKL